MSRSLKKGPFVDTPLLEKVEAMNRVVTALAAYRLAVNEMGMDPNVRTELVDGKRISGASDFTTFVFG